MSIYVYVLNYRSYLHFFFFIVLKVQILTTFDKSNFYLFLPFNYINSRFERRKGMARSLKITNDHLYENQQR